MKIARTTLFLAAASVLGAGCFYTPTEPEPEPVRDCERRLFADLTFQNVSQRSTHDLYMNGSHWRTLSPGQSETFPKAAANVEHTFIFRFAGTSALACQPGTVILTACINRGFTCSGDR